MCRHHPDGRYLHVGRNGQFSVTPPGLLCSRSITSKRLSSVMPWKTLAQPGAEALSSFHSDLLPLKLTRRCPAPSSAPLPRRSALRAAARVRSGPPCPGAAGAALGRIRLRAGGGAAEQSPLWWELRCPAPPPRAGPLCPPFLPFLPRGDGGAVGAARAAPSSPGCAAGNASVWGCVRRCCSPWLLNVLGLKLRPVIVVKTLIAASVI